MKPTDLRGILQYIPRFREKTFILSVDGAMVTDENFANILLDVAVLRSLNIRVVIVHGAAAQISALAEQQGVKPSDLDGAGITDAETLKLALTAANRLTHEILEGLSAQRPPRRLHQRASSRIPWASCRGWITLHRQSRARRCRVVADACWRKGSFRSCRRLGFDGDGKTYRVNSDHVAVAHGRGAQGRRR